ncbi:hypothetical protein F5876DRAFT_36569 [Lentinula aff. lateritia]|uniref:Uncharacterized protein n=1 Tax=Lentinula aff. lateritia TaxID=2804960 RepID=A0ACC1U7N5_9AGAR|nr:hypothetical protein F5876DRAFT_36569 [Lentinula aff. lateritia]
MNTSEFYINELERALSEQAPFIRTFSVDSSSSLQAIGSVTLLEGNVINIEITNRGFHSHQARELPFETIEDLLQTVSPLYTRQRQSVLLDALEKLSSSQPFNGGKDKHEHCG